MPITHFLFWSLSPEATFLKRPPSPSFVPVGKGPYEINTKRRKLTFKNNEKRKILRKFAHWELFEMGLAQK